MTTDMSRPGEPEGLAGTLTTFGDGQDGDPGMLVQQARFSYRPDTDDGPGGLLVQRDELPSELHGLDMVAELDVLLEVQEPVSGRPMEVDPFTIGGWEALRAVAQEDGNPDAAPASAWVEELNRLHADIDARMDPSRPERPWDVPPALASVALGRSMSERILIRETDVPPGVDHDALCRHAIGLEQEREIRMLSGNRNGGRSALPVRIGEELQEQHGLQFLSGASVRAPALVAASSGGHPIHRQRARQTDALIRRVFAPLTQVPPEEMTVGRMPKESAAWFRSEMEEGALADVTRRLEPERMGWLRAVQEEIRLTLLDAFGPSYRPEITFYESAGHDVLLTVDHESACIYSWPTTERQLLFERDGRPSVAIVDPDRCPSSLDLADQRRRIAELTEGLRQMHTLSFGPMPSPDDPDWAEPG